MTGKEHYAEAERLIEMARGAATEYEIGNRGYPEPSSALYQQQGRSQPARDRATLILADAQAHAILALAAAIRAERAAT